ncbi:resolvase [Thauera sinica]|nr:resolvase [Thauera sp. K11]
MVHTSIEHRRVSCRGVLISGCQEPYAQQASCLVDWCSRLLKMTRLGHSLN